MIYQNKLTQINLAPKKIQNKDVNQTNLTNINKIKDSTPSSKQKIKFSNKNTTIIDFDKGQYKFVTKNRKSFVFQLRNNNKKFV